MKVYVEAQSKADLIRRLSAGEEITGYNYSMFGGGGHYMLDNTLEDGTIIAIYSQMSQGNPVAKSWGTWTNGVLKAESFEAPKICWECNKEWEYGSRDKSHSNFCHDCSPRPETFESPVSCKICGKTFASFRGLNGHMNAHLPSHRKRAEYGELPPVSCKICGKTFDGFHELADHTAIHHPESRRFEADEPSIVRGTWGSGVVEFSNGEVFVKVITFPVTDDSGLGGESMWVILEEGNEFEGIGILDNDPIHSEIKVGSRIKFTGGNTHYKPHFVAVVQNMEAEGDEPTIEHFFVDMSDLLTTYSGGDWDWDSEARGGVLQFSGHLTPTNGENFYQYDLDDETFEARGTSGWQVECSKCGVKGHNKSTCGKPKPKVQKKPKQKKKKYVRKTIK